MYDFILNQWILRKFTKTNVQNCVTKAYITQDQANTILSNSQIS